MVHVELSYPADLYTAYTKKSDMFMILIIVAQTALSAIPLVHEIV